ncbi:replication protein A 70 kDa DNA-binding subunit C-like [Senna tora]|uniref:Replication protein A 70 kDa DNA-binding subunit C-like n=1 Tax=Senna tora TaxID=362788 RepID=A0A834TGZ8_9FABA|nr:replication protein A 70 kDa DNA-binding subunit C-like [Senna tora]
MSQGMATMFDSIRGIHALRTDWTIKVRVLRLWKAPPYPKNSPHSSLEMVLCDREGTKIGAHVKSPFAVKLLNVLKEGSVYVMSQFTVGSNSGNFRAAKHEFKLNFQFQTRIAQTDDDESIEKYGFEFLHASTIFAPDFDKDILVDVIGRLIHMSDVQQASSDPKTKRVNIQLEDQMKSKITITLWGSFVEQLLEYSRTHSDGAIVIAIQYCKIKEYGGLQHEELASPIIKNLTNPATHESPLEAAFAELPLSSIQDFYHARDSSLFVVLASVLKVNVDRGWFKVELMILDDSGTANVTIFDKDVEGFLGISAIDLRREHLQMPEKFDRFLGQMFVFKILVKTMNWNNSYSFTVQKMTSDHDLVEKFKRMAKAKLIDVGVVPNSLTTPGQTKAVTHLGLDARRLSFVGDNHSPSSSNACNGKRSHPDSPSDNSIHYENAKNGEATKKKLKDII